MRNYPPSGFAKPLLLVSCTLLLFLTTDCGGSGNGLIITPTATPTLTPTPTSTPTPTPPFNTQKGEGNLISGQLVATYSTSTSDTVSGLDTFYTQTICPTQLSPSDCAQNEASLNTPQFGNFDVSADPIANNALGIKLVDAVKIDYTAINVDQSAVTVSGGIVIPEVAPASIKGLVLYFHGTTVDRTNVPSNFLTPSNPDSPNQDGVLLAAIWASQGYVVVMPDYIGLGDDTSDPHPYVVYPVQNAQSGLAMVKAARSYLASAYGINGPLALHVTGYSEGGAYSLQAAHMMQDNSGYGQVLNVDLTNTVPLSGAFDLSNTSLQYLFYNISTADNPWYSLSPLVSAGSKPYLTADLALSFSYYANIAPTDIFVTPFYVCASGEDLPCGSSGNLQGLYYSNNSDSTVIAATVVQASNTSWSLFGDNSIQPLLTTTYATALMQQDLSNPLYAQTVSADTYLFSPSFPLTLVSLMQDSVVTRVNTDVAYSYFTQNNPDGPYQEELINNNNFLTYNSLTGTSGPIDHTSELPFLSVLILNQFNTQD